MLPVTRDSGIQDAAAGFHSFVLKKENSQKKMRTPHLVSTSRRCGLRCPLAHGDAEPGCHAQACGLSLSAPRWGGDASSLVSLQALTTSVFYFLSPQISTEFVNFSGFPPRDLALSPSAATASRAAPSTERECLQELPACSLCAAPLQPGQSRALLGCSLGCFCNRSQERLSSHQPLHQVKLDEAAARSLPHGAEQ